MNNESKVQGSQNIVIQGITDSTITVNVNGETKEIANKLDALNTLLERLHAQTFQTEGSVYNVGSLNEDNFGFITGKKAFNEHLTKVLIEAMKEDSVPAQRFLEKVKDIPNWESQVRIGDKAKEIIAYSFVGAIGVQLSKLMAIGKEDLSESKQRKYIQKCLRIAKRTLDILCFSLVSDYWDSLKDKAITVSEAQKKVLTHFFHSSFEFSIKEQARLLKTLLEIFQEHELDSPLPELNGFLANLMEEAEFCGILVELQQFNENLDKTQVSLLACFDVEALLAKFLVHLRFLVRYSMVSIKKIGYQQLRNSDPHYLHRYTALGIDSKANVDAEKLIYTPETTHTSSVLFYRGKDYQNSVNLFPFVVDYNALTYEHGAKICFYQCKNITDESLVYLFLEDNSTQLIEYQAILDSDVERGELMMDVDKRKIVNLDMVVSQFEEAKKVILGDQPESASEPDFSDLFDD